VFALFVDIDGLKIANDRYGHAFGDDVIQLSGQAVQASVRGGDLVARWGGDELVVLGIGHHPAPGDFARRLDEHVNLSGIDRARWPGHLSVGFAQGDPSTVSVDELIGRADADMYGRRGTR
jgi:diguanylate cyclase